VPVHADNSGQRRAEELPVAHDGRVYSAQFLAKVPERLRPTSPEARTGPLPCRGVVDPEHAAGSVNLMTTQACPFLPDAPVCVRCLRIPEDRDGIIDNTGSLAQPRGPAEPSSVDAPARPRLCPVLPRLRLHHHGAAGTCTREVPAHPHASVRTARVVVRLCRL